MRKRYLFFAGFLLLLFCAGCYDDRLDSEAWDGTVRPPFDVGDAKAWFDAHVEQLNLLQLSKSPVTRGVKLTDKPLLTPQWGKGNAQSNDYLQVVEIPLQTSSVSFVYRNLYRSGQAVINENCIAQRKMVVMRRPNGYTRLFVMTLIPDREYPRKNFDFITDFRYLGKNDFSGYVMFSDPDGSFVEGYHYWEGYQEYPVQVTQMAEADGIIASAAEYTTLSITERGVSNDSTYATEEKNYICDYCDGEGCPECANPDCPQCHGAGCTHCKSVPLPPVVVTPPDPPIDPGPNIPIGPIDNRCPRCGLVTCNGNCITGGGGSTPPPPPVDECPGEKCSDCGGIIPGTEPLTKSAGNCATCKCEVKATVYCPRNATILEEYNITTRVKPTASLVTNYTFEIARQNTEEWHCIQSGVSPVCRRISRSSGYWKVRVIVNYGEKEYPSDPDNVEERFPTVKQIQNDPFVKSNLDAYWELTKKFAESNKGQRREYGCWIYLDTSTGRYEIKDLPPGPIISGGEGTHGSISPGGVPETVLTNPLQSMNEYVAVFHTHTPLTYCEGEGVRKPTGPSLADTEWAWTKNIPGIVYDYQPNGVSGGIITGHPLNASAMLYTFGPNRRPTKK